MNPVAKVHLVAGMVGIVAAVPLLRGKVKMNPWYGVRIPAAFTSDESWFDINRYGGRLLLCWAVLIAIMAIVGTFLARPYWVAYDLVASIVVLVGLVVVITKIAAYARKRPRA